MSHTSYSISQIFYLEAYGYQLHPKLQTYKESPSDLLFLLSRRQRKFLSIVRLNSLIRKEEGLEQYATCSTICPFLVQNLTCPICPNIPGLTMQRLFQTSDPYSPSPTPFNSSHHVTYPTRHSILHRPNFLLRKVGDKKREENERETKTKLPLVSRLSIFPHFSFCVFFYMIEWFL